MRNHATLGGWAPQYILSVVVVVVASLVRWMLPAVLERTPFLSFYPAVVIAAAFGGMGPGLVATIGSAGCAGVLFDATPGWDHFADPLVLGRLAIFLAGGVGTSLVGGSLRRTGQRLRATFDNAGVGIIEADAQGRFLAVNDRLCHVLGYRRHEMLGMTVHDLTCPEDRGHSDRVNEELRAGRCDHLDYEKRYVDRAGSSLWVHVTVSAVRDAAGRAHRFIATVEDITARRRIEDQQRLQAAALEAAANAIAITDADGRIEWANPAFCAMTGYCLDELIGRTHRILKSGRQDEAFYRNLWETVGRGEVWRGELVNRRKDGTLYSEEMSVTPLRDGAGRINRYIAIKQEITARKRAEEEAAAARVSAEKAKAAAEEANAAKDHFLAVLSHELRTPLTPVLATVLMLEKQCPNPDLHEMLEVIRRNVEMEARLIDDLLDVTRIARGKVQLDRQPVTICEIIEHAAQVCRPDIEARKLRFAVEVKDPPHTVYADAGRMEQVLWNLLRNAIKFTPPEGLVAIRCWREQGTVIVEVSDSGIGIEPEMMGRLFRPFEQGGVGATRRFGGLGLGLTICKAMVELHGGTIEGRSDGKNKGATFTVKLPLHVGAGHALPSVHLPGGVNETRARHASPLRILLVEDHGDTARIMARLLAEDGHQVQTAGDVATALRLAGQQAFDLLLSDLGLPDGSGIDLICELRARGIGMPAIAVSGYGRDEDIRRSREAGFAAHLTKPTTPERLAAAIASVLAPVEATGREM